MITLSIVHEAQKNDSGAQRMIFDVYGKQLYRLAKRYLFAHESARDAVAEGMYVILCKLPSADFAAIPPFEMWMKRIVINECLQMIRQEKRFDLFPDYSEVEIPLVDEMLIENLTADSILKLIGELPTGYRTIFNLYEIEGYTHTEIAGMLGISAGTSKSQLSKAKSLLQKRITELDPAYAQRKVI